MQTSPFSYHELHTNNTKTIHNQKLSKILNFHSHKLSIHIITLYKKMKVPFKVTTTSLNTNQKGNYSRNFLRETTQETS
jgi:hypothetical protein